MFFTEIIEILKFVTKKFLLGVSFFSTQLSSHNFLNI